MHGNVAAFDAFAQDYDETFTRSRLGKLLRPRVWHRLAEHFAPGQHILELACGTGEDAIWLAQQGIRVTATDASPQMVNIARTKAETSGLSAQIKVNQLSLQEISQRDLVRPSSFVAGPFDGVFSNFGGLNTIGDWRPLAQALSKIVRPGGKLILVPMGPFCPWETVWYLVHGQPKTAFRRLRKPAPAKIGDAVIPIWYPSARRLQADFADWFNHGHTESLGLWLPPSYLDHFVERWPGVFAKLNQFEKTTTHLTKGWGDHYIIVFKRK